MPSIIESTQPQGADDEITDEQVESLLVGEGDELSIAGRVVESFIQSVDFGALMDDADVAEHIDARLIPAELLGESALGLDELITLAEASGQDVGEDVADDAVIIETLDGDYAAAFIDEDDLSGMFDDYVSMVLHEDAQGDDLDAKALYVVALEMLDDGDDDSDEVDEGRNPTITKKSPKLTGKGGWNRGAFRAIHKNGDKTLVNRMLGAMLRKQAITRSTKGAGYRPNAASGAKGDYGPAKGPPPTVWSKYPTGGAAGEAKSKAIQKKGSSKAKLKRNQKSNKSLRLAGKATKAKDAANKVAAKIKAKKSEKKPGGGKAKESHDAPANLTEGGYPVSYGGITESDACPGQMTAGSGQHVAANALKSLGHKPKG